MHNVTGEPNTFLRIGKKMKNASDHGLRRRAVFLLEIVFTFCSLLLRDDSMPVRAAALAITL